METTRRPSAGASAPCHWRRSAFRCRSAGHSSRPGSRITSGPRWRLAITTVDAESGEFVVLTNTSDVDLVDAVAASCAIPRVWPAVPIHGRRLFDGGMRSGTNADVAKDHGKVLVLDVIGFPETTDVEPVSAPVLTVTPDEASQAGLQNLLDPDSRAICARAGYDQGQRIAAEVKAFWA